MQSFEEFRKLSEGADRIPVVRRVIGDLETPVSVLARLADDENVFLLESVEAGEKFGRYSFIGLNPRGVFTVEEGRACYADREGKRELPAPDGPFLALRTLLGSGPDRGAVGTASALRRRGRISRLRDGWRV